MKLKPEFLRGMTDGIPIGLGYLSVSFAFGIYTVEQGLSLWEAVMISMTCVTSKDSWRRCLSLPPEAVW